MDNTEIIENLKTEGKINNGQHRNNCKILKQKGKSIMDNTEITIVSVFSIIDFPFCFKILQLFLCCPL
jgi:hypothetical protein